MEVPEFFIGGYFGAGAGDFSPEMKQSDQKSGDHFAVDDLLDFSNEDSMIIDGFFDNAAGNSTDSSAVTAVDSCNSSVSGGEPQFFCNRSFGDCKFAGELCVPYDDLAELEWLSNFVEGSCSTEKDLQALQFVSSSKATTNISTKPHTPKTSSLPNETARNAAFFQPETPLPGKARSKRSRAAPGDWSTRLVELITPNHENKPVKTTSSVKREGSISNRNSEYSGRKCLHCATDKTPQWRTGPMGPKTLCNACGVRYKSGRLVPEYRPAASPTYVSSKHSNSHRKVLELRRQKDDVKHLLSQSSIFGVSNDGHDFLIHHHTGPDFRHMI